MTDAMIDILAGMPRPVHPGRVDLFLEHLDRSIRCRGRRRLLFRRPLRYLFALWRYAGEANATYRRIERLPWRDQLRELMRKWEEVPA